MPENQLSYHEQFQEYIRLGYVALADPKYTGVHMYLPHTDIRNENSETTKCRPVFDGSSHHRGSPSINQVLEAGPNLNPELLAVLLQLRLWEIGWTADIAKAFLQIELAEEDSQAIRFLWVDDPTDPNSPVREYRWTRVPFGLTCSPFILRAVLLKHLKLYEDRYPETAKQLRDQLYVDDWIGGADSPLAAAKTIREALIIFGDAKMTLLKWSTNSKELQTLLEGTVSFKKQSASLVNSNTSSESKALGVYWNQESDQFVFKPQALLKAASKFGKTPTKRQIFSLALRLFDPLGLLAPVVLVAKLIMQRLWETHISWDETVPETIASQWYIFLAGLIDLKDVAIDRWVGTKQSEPIQLHVFCDAREDAYAAAIYVKQLGNPAKCRLLCSKTRVAPSPKKSVTIPRLELLSNLLASRIVSYAKKAYHRHECQIQVWTDSTIALCWIKGESGRWKTFVHNRVTQIREVFSTEEIRHCPGLENPADLASRGASTAHLLRANEWWHGPHWLKETESHWPVWRGLTDPSPEALREARDREIGVMTAIVERNCFHERFSSYTRMTRITAWVLRFVNRCRGILEIEVETPVIDVHINGITEKVNLLSPSEIKSAKIMCLRIAQRDAYPAEYEALSKGKTLGRHSHIDRLRPVWDPERKLIRGAGRTERAERDQDMKLPPLILPPYHYVTTLTIRQAHKTLKHSGVSSTQRYLRDIYWIPKARQRIKVEIDKWVPCQKLNSRKFECTSAQLPKDRVTRLEPFEVCGVDFAGPFTVWTEEFKSHMNPPPHTKAYACIFTCTSTRATHIETVPNQSATSFLFALRKFIAERGVPRKLYSDNSKTFEFAATHLKNIRHYKHVNDYLNGHHITWKFSPSLAPWWGGFWERMVKNMKHHFNTAVGVKFLDYQQFEVILKEIQYVMNIRPLTYLNQEEGYTLTPFQLLTGRKPSRTEFDVEETEDNEDYSGHATPQRLSNTELIRREQLEEWWIQWQEDYLDAIKKFCYEGSKRKGIKGPEVGQVVIIHEENQPRMKWVTGRIKELIPSEDGIVRQVILVNSKKNEITRPVQRLYPLEAHAGRIDYDPTNTGTRLPPEAIPDELNSPSSVPATTSGTPSAIAFAGTTAKASDEENGTQQLGRNPPRAQPVHIQSRYDLRPRR